MPDPSRDNNDVGFASNIQPNIKHHMVFYNGNCCFKIRLFRSEVYIYTGLSLFVEKQQQIIHTNFLVKNSVM